MIKRLRNKFILIMMSIVALILGAIFFALFTSTRTNLEMSSRAVLTQELNNINMPAKQGLPPAGFMTPPDGFRAPTLLLQLDDSGNLEVLKNHFYTFDEEDLAEIAAGVTENGILTAY